MVNNEKKGSGSSEKDNQVAWNMASLINMELAKRNDEANSAYISKNYGRAFECKVAMKQTAVFSFTPEERAAFEFYETNARILVQIVALKGSWKKSEVVAGLEAERMFKSMYDRYSILLSDTLDKHGFMGARKQDASEVNVGA